MADTGSANPPAGDEAPAALATETSSSTLLSSMSDTVRPRRSRPTLEPINCTPVPVTPYVARAPAQVQWDDAHLTSTVSPALPPRTTTLPPVSTPMPSALKGTRERRADAGANGSGSPPPQPLQLDMHRRTFSHMRTLSSVANTSVALEKDSPIVQLQRAPSYQAAAPTAVEGDAPLPRMMSDEMEGPTSDERTLLPTAPPPAAMARTASFLGRVAGAVSTPLVKRPHHRRVSSLMPLNNSIREGIRTLATAPSAVFPESDFHRRASAGAWTLMTEVPSKDNTRRVFRPNDVTVSVGDTVIFRWFSNQHVVEVDGHGERMVRDLTSTNGGRPQPPAGESHEPHPEGNFTPKSVTCEDMDMYGAVDQPTTNGELVVLFKKPGVYYFVSLRHQRCLRATIRVTEHRYDIAEAMIRTFAALAFGAGLIAAVTQIVFICTSGRHFFVPDAPTDGTDDGYGGWRRLETTVIDNVLPWIVASITMVIGACGVSCVHRCQKVRLRDFGRGYTERVQVIFQVLVSVLSGILVSFVFIEWTAVLQTNHGFENVFSVFLSGVAELVNIVTATLADVDYIISIIPQISPSATVPTSAYKLITQIESLLTQVKTFTSVGQTIVNAVFRGLAIIFFLALQSFLYVVSSGVVAVRRRRSTTMSASRWLTVLGMVLVMFNAATLAVLNMTLELVRDVGSDFDNSVLTPAKLQSYIGVGADSEASVFIAACNAGGVLSIDYMNEQIQQIVTKWNEDSPSEYLLEAQKNNFTNMAVLVQYADYVSGTLDALQAKLAANASLGKELDSLSDNLNGVYLPAARAAVRIVKALFTVTDCAAFRDLIHPVIPLLEADVMEGFLSLTMLQYYQLCVLVLYVYVSVVAAHVFDRPHKYWYEPKTQRWFRFRACFLAHRRLLMKQRILNSEVGSQAPSTPSEEVRYSPTEPETPAVMVEIERPKPHPVTTMSHFAAATAGTKHPSFIIPSVNQAAQQQKSPLTPATSEGSVVVHSAPGSLQASPVMPATHAGAQGTAFADAANMSVVSLPAASTEGHPIPPPLPSQQHASPHLLTAAAQRPSFRRTESMLHLRYAMSALTHPGSATWSDGGDSDDEENFATFLDRNALWHAPSKCSKSSFVSAMFQASLLSGAMLLLQAGLLLLLHKSNVENELSTKLQYATGLCVVFPMFVWPADTMAHLWARASLRGLAFVDSVVIMTLLLYSATDDLNAAQACIAATSHNATSASSLEYLTGPCGIDVTLRDLQSGVSALIVATSCFVALVSSGFMVVFAKHRVGNSIGALFEDVKPSKVLHEVKHALRLPVKMVQQLPANSDRSPAEDGDRDVPATVDISAPVPQRCHACHSRRWARRAYVCAIGVGMVVAAIFAAGLLFGCWFSSSPSTSTVIALNPAGCNGDVRWCAVPINEFAWFTTHNSMSALDQQFIGPNHYFGMPKQLEAGIRAFMIDAHPYPEWSNQTEAYEAWLCHEDCRLGGYKLLRDLLLIKASMQQYPNDVYVLVFEQYSNDSAVVAAFEQAGLVDAIWTPPGSPKYNWTSWRWPTLGGLVAQGKRLIVWTDNSKKSSIADMGARRPAWYGYVWDYMFENVFTAATVANLTCKPNRGVDLNATDGMWLPSMALKLSVLNHFLSAPVGAPFLAKQANTGDEVRSHFTACATQWGLVPNFVVVDFWDVQSPGVTVQQINYGLLHL